jgi:hypothetical protein
VSASEKAIATIRLEHRSLGVVLHTLQSLLGKIAAGHAVADFGLLASALYYIDDFPERCHHPKEDEYLFKRLRLRTSEIHPPLRTHRRAGAAQTENQLAFGENAAASAVSLPPGIGHYERTQP